MHLQTANMLRRAETVMCLASYCQPHLMPQEGRGVIPVIVETAYHYRDKVAVPPARCQRYGEILTTSR